jgi:ATP10 protein
MLIRTCAKMRSAVLWLPLVAACLFAANAAVSAPTADFGHFPAVSATSLDKAHMNLPQEFAGQMNLVVVSFAREQQKEADTWLPLARKIQAAHSNFSFYELATMSRVNLLYRWWFNASLRSDTSDKQMRPRILTAYVDKRNFRKALHIANEKRVVALLVDKTGRVYWRADGRATDQSQQSLQSALAANGM